MLPYPAFNVIEHTMQLGLPFLRPSVAFAFGRIELMLGKMEETGASQGEKVCIMAIFGETACHDFDRDYTVDDISDGSI